ncbi:prepilin peptidase [Candidatus Woesearchaeota archaeon]|nr:prepilin peptidase [Candidatus Woesearchaeota archaeon]
MEVLLVFLFVGLVIAAYRDFLTREIPDTLNYGLIAIGLLGGLIASITYSNILLFLSHLAGFAASFALGMLMYHTRQWGGGDAKLMMGVGAIIGLSTENIDLAAYLILLIFAGSIYGFIHTTAIAMAHRKRFKTAFMKKIREPKVHKLRIGLVWSGALIILLLLFVPIDFKFILGFVLLGIYVLVYSWIFISTIEQTFLVKQIAVKALTEGDWMINDVKVGKKVIVPASATGLSKEQITILKRSKTKTVTVKEGVPFAPSFLLGFILLLAAKQWLGVSIVSLFF